MASETQYLEEQKRLSPSIRPPSHIHPSLTWFGYWYCRLKMHLGVVFVSQLSWNSPVDVVYNKVSKSGRCLMSHCSHLSRECISLFYKCYLLPIFLYGATAWHFLLSKSAVQALEIHHKRVLKIVFCKPSLFPSTDLFSLASTSPISILSQRQSCVPVHRI